MTDQELKKLWDEFENIPVSEDGCIEQQFHTFDSGTDRMDIWHWFDKNHSKGTAYLIGASEG